MGGGTMEKVLPDYMTKEKIHAVTGEFAKEAKEIYGSKLYGIILYGSCARGDFEPDSDIDILVRTEDVAEGCKLAEVKIALEEALEKQVDIVTTGSIKGSLLEDEDLEEVLIYNHETD